MQALVNALTHHENNPSVSRLRHPLVVLFHLPYICLLLVLYSLVSDQTKGQSLYFIVTIGLYISSAAYHAWKPSWLLRFIDQTMISWYVVVVFMPLVYQKPWALPLVLVLFALTALNKWYEWEANSTVGSLVFFSLGILSTGIVLFLGLPQIDVSLWSVTGFWVVISICCFVGKLIIYQYEKLNLIANIWESPESGHFVLSLGVTIYTVIIVMHPVV